MQEAKPIAKKERLTRIKELEQQAAVAHAEAQRLNKEGKFAGWLHPYEQLVDPVVLPLLYQRESRYCTVSSTTLKTSARNLQLLLSATAECGSGPRV